MKKEDKNENKKEKITVEVTIGKELGGKKIAEYLLMRGIRKDKNKDK